MTSDRQSLFDPPARATRHGFDEFVTENPEIIDEIHRLALEARRRGAEHWGIKALWEVARWNLHLRAKGETVHLNNNWTSSVARLLMEREPELAGFFETRRAKADDTDNGGSKP